MIALPIHIPPLHEQLLHVGLSAPELAVEQWQRLAPALDVAHLDDRRARKLLPLVWRALTAAEIDDPQLGALAAIVDETRDANDALLVRLRSALDALDTAAVAVMGLKGVPLVVSVYRDPGLRPMSDADLLVAPADAPRAIDALAAAGWRIVGERPRDFRGRPEVSFRAPDHDAVVDLHWRLEPWVTPDDGRDPELWSAASPIGLGEGTMLAPAAHDLALHVVLHTFKSEWERVVRWIPDLVLLLRSEGDAFDWDVFVRRVVTGGVALQVREALEYVRTEFAAPVPPSVSVELRAVRITRRQTHKDRVASQRASGVHRIFGTGSELRTRWARVSVNYTRRRALQSYPAFLRSRTRVSHLVTLPFVVVRRRVRSGGSQERVDGASQRP